MVMRRSFLLVAVLVAALLAPVGAQAGAASIALSPQVGPPTTKVMVSGTGFTANERVTLAFDRRVLETLRASDGGAFTETIKVPATATPGQHAIVAKGGVSGRSSVPFTVRTDWPTFHFDNAKTGENPYENVLDPSNVGDLQVAWAADVEEFLNAAPVVAGGVAYAVDNLMNVYALDPASGGVIWRSRLSGCCPSDLAFAEGRLYVSSLTAHAMHVLNAKNGRLLMTIPGPTHSPTVVDGVVYATDGNIDGSLWAFDAITGEELWVAHPSSSGYGFGVAVTGGMVFAGAPNGEVYAYDADTGEELWVLDTGGSVWSVPAVVDGVAYLGSSDDLFALDTDSGEVLWRAHTGGSIISSAAVANGVVYTGSTDDYLYALEATTGDVLWRTPHYGAGRASYNPVVAAGVIYLGSLDDSVYAYDAAIGDQLWSYQTGNVAAEVIVTDGTLYADSQDDHLYAFRLPGARGPNASRAAKR